MLEVGIEQHGSDAARRAAERSQRLSGDIVGTSMIRVRAHPPCKSAATPAYQLCRGTRATAKSSRQLRLDYQTLFCAQIFLKETEGSYEHSIQVGTEPFSVAEVRCLCYQQATLAHYLSSLLYGLARALSTQQ